MSCCDWLTCLSLVVGQTEAMKALIKQGAATDGTIRDGRTILEVATSTGQIDSVTPDPANQLGHGLSRHGSSCHGLMVEGAWTRTVWLPSTSFRSADSRLFVCERLSPSHNRRWC